jgi:hypothetical protein
MPTARQYASSCVLNNGNILVAGGYDSSGTAVTDVYIFQSTANAWITAASLGTARGEAEMVKLPGSAMNGDDDRCLVVGGKGSVNGTALGSAEYYDLPANAWVATPALSQSRANFKMSVCGTGSGFGAAGPAKVIVFGGHTNQSPDVYRDQVEVWNANVNAWTTLDLNPMAAGTQGLSTARAYLALGVDDANLTHFVVSGGENAGGPLTNVDLVEVTTACAFSDSNAGSCTLGTARAAMTTARRWPVLSSYGTNKYDIVGGMKANGESVDAVQVWDGTAGVPA